MTTVGFSWCDVSAYRITGILRARALWLVINLSIINLVPRAFVPLDQRSEYESSGSNHFEITKEIAEFCPSSFTTQSASMAHGSNGCSKSSRFPTAGQGERRLWERDWSFIVSVPDPVSNTTQYERSRELKKTSERMSFISSFGFHYLRFP